MDPSERSQAFTEVSKSWDGSVRTLSGLHRLELEMLQAGRSSGEGWEWDPQPSQYSHALAQEPCFIFRIFVLVCIGINLRRLRSTTYRTDPVQVRSCFINVYCPPYIPLLSVFPEPMWEIYFTHYLLFLLFPLPVP